MKTFVYSTTEGGLQAAADKMREISKRKDAEAPQAHLTEHSVSVKDSARVGVHCPKCDREDCPHTAGALESTRVCPACGVVFCGACKFLESDGNECRCQNLMLACWDLAHDINASMGQPAESDVRQLYDFVRERGGR